MGVKGIGRRRVRGKQKGGKRNGDKQSHDTPSPTYVYTLYLVSLGPHTAEREGSQLSPELWVHVGTGGPRAVALRFFYKLKSQNARPLAQAPPKALNPISHAAVSGWCAPSPLPSTAIVGESQLRPPRSVPYAIRNGSPGGCVGARSAL